MAWLTGDVNNGPGVSGVTSSGSNVSNVQNAEQIARDYADELYDRQVEREDYIMGYNSAEAEKSRNWSREMRQTAYQDTVQDMIAAGLNPVLAAKIGATSSSSGVSASYGSSSAASIAGSTFGSVFSSALGLLQTLLTNQSREDQTQAKIQSDEKQTSWKLNTQMSIAQLNSTTKLTATQLNIDADKWQTAIKNINARELERLEWELKRQFEDDYPSNILQAIWPNVQEFIKGFIGDENASVGAAMNAAGEFIYLSAAGLFNDIDSDTMVYITNSFSNAPVEICIDTWKKVVKSGDQQNAKARYKAAMQSKGYQFTNS